MVEFRIPDKWDVPHIVAGMRQADVDECHALGVDSIPNALQDGLIFSSECWTITWNGKPVALFGVRPLNDDPTLKVGVPWMVGTNEVTKHQRAVISLAPRYIARMLRAYPRLTNRVHAENTRAIRWLRHVGFQLEPVHRHPVTGAPFHWFSMEA